MNYTRTIFKISFSKFDAVLYILFGISLSRLLIDIVAVAVYNLGSERLPALLTICLFGCLACVWGFVCRLSKHSSAVHSVVIVCFQGTSVSYLNSY